MASKAFGNAPMVTTQELFTSAAQVVLQTVNAARAVIIQKENFRIFSTYLEEIASILKALSDFNIKEYESLYNVLENLKQELGVSRKLALECSTRNGIYLLLYCRRITKHLDKSTKNIAHILSLITLCLPDVSSRISEQLSKLHMDLLRTEYQSSAAEEEILRKIESGIQDGNVDRSHANNLLISIASLVGFSTERLELKVKFEEFKREVKCIDPGKDIAEALKMEQVILLLEKADMMTTHEEKEKTYLNKRNSLHRQPSEPLKSFYCPISGDVMEDPVETSSGQTFERKAIEQWLDAGNNLCPLTKIPLNKSSLRPNKALQQSIKEWKSRSIMTSIASLKPNIQSSDEQEVLCSLKKLQDLYTGSELHREWIILEDFVPVVTVLIHSNVTEIRKHALATLYILVKDNNDSMEKIVAVESGLESIVRSLARKVEESKLALQLLLELSRSNIARDFIGSVQSCIILLVAMSNSEDIQAAEYAHEVLKNLSSLDQNVVLMARAKYFGPLLQLLRAGPQSKKIYMACTLSDTELTDCDKVCLSRDGALKPLLEMLSHNDIEMKTASVKALQNLSSVTQNGHQIIKEGAISPLLEILFRHSLSLPRLQEQVAATIMNLALSACIQEADEFEGTFLVSEEDVFKLFSLISLTGPTVQQSILRTFHALSKCPSGFDIRSKLRQISAVKLLVQLCELDDQSVRADAVKLFYYLTVDGDETTFSEHVGKRCMENLVRISETSNNEAEIASAIGIIGNLPKDSTMSQHLLDSGALQVIIDCLRRNKHAVKMREVIENATGALCRFTLPTDMECQKKVAEAGIIPLLVELLTIGSSLTKQNVATSLRQFSESSTVLSRSIKKNRGLGCCFAPTETGCPVHLGICSLESSFCLLEANALGPLVTVLLEPDIGACEASFDALLTLIEGDKLQNGCKVLSEAKAILPITKLVSSSYSKLQEKALRALERIFSLVEYKQRYGLSAQMPLVDITQRGSSNMKSLAAKVLAQLNVLHEQSSFF